MAKITLTFEAFEDADGYDGTVTISRHNVDDLQDLLWFFSESARAVGYNYIESIGAQKGNGEEAWSLF